MITLYGMPPAGGLRQLSPYVVKVEMALTYLNAEYKSESVDPWKIGKLSPNGKVPWIKVDNLEIGESDVIIEHLVKVYKSDLLASLGTDDQLLGTALKRLTEKNLYWYMVWSKFMTSESREEIIGCFFSRYPKFIQTFASRYVIKSHTSFSKVHEVGNLSEARRDAEATADLMTLSLQLEKDDFLLGPEITVFDFSIAAMLASILFHTPKTWLTVMAESYPVFPAYLTRVSDRLGRFPFSQSEPTP
jgi:glutathione S-transferase